MSSSEVPCRICGTPTTNMCSNCKTTHYCKRECQVLDWKASHKYTCAKLPAALKTVPLRFCPRGHRLTDTSALCLLAEHVTGNETPGQTFEGFYRHPATARQDLGGHLKKLVGGSPLDVDCSLFVQLVLAAEGKLGPKQGPLVFAVGGYGPWLVMKRVLEDKTIYPGVNSQLLPGYYAPADPDAAQAVARAPTSGGQWLLGPDANRFYLGMSKEGPVRLPLAEWHKRLMAGLREELQDMSPEDRQTVSFLLVDDLGPDKYQVYREPEKVDD